MKNELSPGYSAELDRDFYNILAKDYPKLKDQIVSLVVLHNQTPKQIDARLRTVYPDGTLINLIYCAAKHISSNRELFKAVSNAKTLE
jgi:hypothetical protein